jgi:putative oxidoreductase
MINAMLDPLDDQMTYGKREILLSISLLILRLGSGIMMIVGHGWSKLIHFGDKASVFPDPIGLGSQISLSLTVFSEFFCSIAIIFGLATRLAAIPLIVTMLVAAFIIHTDNPWQKKEFALLYLVPFLTLVFSGAGRFSLDYIICTRRKKVKEK